MLRLPTVARWLLERVVAQDERAFLIADLDEEFETILQSRGRVAARRWYWSQVLRSISPSLMRRLSRVRSAASRPRALFWLAALNHDVRSGAKALVRSPVFSAVVVITVSIGLATTGSVLTVVNSILIQRLPFAEPNQLVLLREADMERGGAVSRVSPPNFLDWRAQAVEFADVAAFSPAGVVVQQTERALQVPAMHVSANLFGVLRVHPGQGRTFSRADELTGANAVTVVSQAFWRRFFGDRRLSESDAVLTLNDVPHRIIGVLPDDFSFVTPVDVWIPLTFGAAQREEAMRGARYLDVVGRLTTDLGIEHARDRFTQLAMELSSHPNNQGWGVSVTPWHDHVTAELKLPIAMLTAAVAFVALIIVANVATLVMARVTRQWRQFAVRAALGASRVRLYQQIFVELALLLAVSSLAAGILATWMLDVLVAMAPLTFPEYVKVGFSGSTVVAIGLAAIVLTVVLSGAAMFVSTRRTALAGLRGSHAASESGRILLARHSLIVTEIAISVVLVISAMLLTQSFLRLRTVDPGFSTGRVMVGFVGLQGQRYTSPEAKAAFGRRLQQALENTETIEIAAIGTNVPMTGSNMNFGYDVEGVAQERLSAQYHAVSSSYFASLDIPFRFGATFSDRAGMTPTVVINETLARRFWGDKNPVGNRITVVSQTGPVSREIVGVIGDVRHANPTALAVDEVYVPFVQDPWAFLTLVVKSGPDVAAVLTVEAIQQQLAGLDARVPIVDLVPLSDVVARWRAPVRFQMVLAALFAAFALLLAALGVYGVVAYFVSIRTNEIGVRMAIGASRVDILGMVVGRNVTLTALGVLIGLVGAYLLTHAMDQLLYDISPRDTTVYLASTLIVVLLSLTASALPARRAASVDPVRALREL